MLIAHKVIDALLGLDKTLTLMSIPGVTIEHKQSAAAKIREAEKFDFGELILEPNPNVTGSWRLPELTIDEWQFWKDGLIPLPAPICWYEVVINGFRSAVLIYQRDSVICTERFDLVRNEVLFDAIVTTADRNAVKPGLKWDTFIEGNTEFINKMSRDHTFIQNHLLMNIPLVVYLTLMINSKTTEIRSDTPSEKLNKSRIGRRVTPLAAHRIVTIVPNRFRHQAGSSMENRRSPRLHWRRSHLRHYASGKLAVIPRMLVGKSELGEVSHEYKVKQ